MTRVLVVTLTYIWRAKEWPQDFDSCTDFLPQTPIGPWRNGASSFNCIDSLAEA